MMGASDKMLLVRCVDKSHLARGQLMPGSVVEMCCCVIAIGARVCCAISLNENIALNFYFIFSNELTGATLTSLPSLSLFFSCLMFCCCRCRFLSSLETSRRYVCSCCLLLLCLCLYVPCCVVMLFVDCFLCAVFVARVYTLVMIHNTLGVYARWGFNYLLMVF